MYLFVPLILSLASLGSFFEGYKLLPGVDCFSLQPHSPTNYVVFVDLMLAHFFGARGSRLRVSIPLGTVVLAAMVFVLISCVRRLKSKTYTAKDSVPAVFIAYGLLFCAATAYGRSCLGAFAAFAGRYSEYTGLGVLGLYFYSLGYLPTGHKQWARRMLLGLLLAILLIGSVPIPPADRYAMQYYHDVKTKWRNCYLRTEDIQKCDQAAGLWIYPAPERTDLKEKLEYLKESKQNLYSDFASSWSHAKCRKVMPARREKPVTVYNGVGVVKNFFKHTLVRLGSGFAGHSCRFRIARKKSRIRST